MEGTDHICANNQLRFKLNRWNTYLLHVLLEDTSRGRTIQLRQYRKTWFTWIKQAWWQTKTKRLSGLGWTRLDGRVETDSIGPSCTAGNGDFSLNSPPSCHNTAPTVHLYIAPRVRIAFTSGVQPKVQTNAKYVRQRSRVPAAQYVSSAYSSCCSCCEVYFLYILNLLSDVLVTWRPHLSCTEQLFFTEALKVHFNISVRASCPSPSIMYNTFSPQSSGIL